MIAMASSLGFLTTQLHDETFGRTWHVTISGLQHLKERRL